jgi:signal transduction histidine kinase
MDHPGEVSNRATRAASLGLALVVVCLAAFSIFAAYTTETEVASVQRSQTLHDAYQRASTAFLERERSELEYLVEASPEQREGLDSANAALVAALDEIAARGGEADATLVKDLLALHAQYLEVLEGFIAFAVVGDQAAALRMEQEQANPIVDGMKDRIAAAAREREVQAQSALAELRNTAQWTLILAPVVFAIGFVLLLGLWRVLEQYQRATRKTYQAIEQLSKLRSEFVSIVSHEFRTPLTGIQGFSEMMRDEELTLAEMREYAGDINKGALRLARLISDMLDLDRMESGRMTLKIEPVDLNRIVVDTAAQFRLSATDHPIELHLDDRLPKLMGDSDRLTQVVTNFLSNAIKYSPSGGAVELRTKRGERSVMLTVRDHGMGIPAEQLETIFDRYSRVETAATHGIQGTGLGLPIVRQIVQLHAGKVWATSASGDGSVFHVQLPLPEAAAIAQRAA